MKFPHIAWAVSKRGLAQYRLAALVGCSEARLSRCLSGRSDFREDERAAISRTLGLPEAWLFQEVAPPAPFGTAERAASLA
jgi:transcriptional regulator with XRE-family HTH domain